MHCIFRITILSDIICLHILVTKNNLIEMNIWTQIYIKGFYFFAFNNLKLQLHAVLHSVVCGITSEWIYLNDYSVLKYLSIFLAYLRYTWTHLMNI